MSIFGIFPEGEFARVPLKKKKSVEKQSAVREELDERKALLRVLHELRTYELERPLWTQERTRYHEALKKLRHIFWREKGKHQKFSKALVQELDDEIMKLSDPSDPSVLIELWPLKESDRLIRASESLFSVSESKRLKRNDLLSERISRDLGKSQGFIRSCIMAIFVALKFQRESTWEIEEEEIV